MNDALMLHLDALQSAMGIKFKDPAGVASAFTAAVQCCSEPEADEMEQDDGKEKQGKGPRKGMSLGILLGGK